MATIIGADAAKLAGLQIDLLQKARQDQVTLDHLEWFIKLSKSQRDMLSGADLSKLKSVVPNIDWKATYKELGIAAPCALITREDDFWYMPVTEEVTCDLIIKTLRRLGITCDLYIENLDADVRENDRHPKSGVYTVKMRRRIEADEEFKNLSADQLKERGHSGITLLEQLLLFLGYYVTTKQYLDVENWTLCSGSRYSVDYVPYVHWDPSHRRLYVSWTHRGYRYDDLRSREAVLL